MSMDRAQHHALVGQAKPLFWTVVALAVVNFFAAAIAVGAKSDHLVGLLFGALAGELGLLAGWLAMGSGALLVRLALVVLAAVVLYTAFVLGVATNESSPPPAEIIAAPLLFPLLLLTAGLPIWIFALLTRCQIRFNRQSWRPAVRNGTLPAGDTGAGDVVETADLPTTGPAFTERSLSTVANGQPSQQTPGAESDHADGDRGAARSGQFGLQQMLVLTGLVSLGLAMVRAFCGLVATRGNEDEMLAAAAVVVLGGSGLVALSVVPCLAAMVFLRDWQTRLATLSLYAVGLTIAVIVAAMWLFNEPLDAEFVTSTMLCGGGLLLTLLGVPLAIDCEFVRGRGPGFTR